ncbi:MAG: hypothetical protein ACKO23_00290, partial [Gemmataceae bacterium]
MPAWFSTVVILLGLASGLLAKPAADYSVKVVSDTAPPKELAESLRKLLSDTCIQFYDASETMVFEFWPSKEIAAKATPVQVKNGLTYREIPTATVLGACRLPRTFIDYRKQRIQPGVYTLRLAIQPMDGDHMGTAPYTDFALLCPAADDRKPDLMEAKELRELSAKSTESHPGVLMLFPGKGAGKDPKLVDKGMGHRVLLFQVPAVASEEKALLDIGLTLVGAS